jgi:hypothetical protein
MTPHDPAAKLVARQLVAVPEPIFLSAPMRWRLDRTARAANDKIYWVYIAPNEELVRALQPADSKSYGGCKHHPSEMSPARGPGIAYCSEPVSGDRNANDPHSRSRRPHVGRRHKQDRYADPGDRAAVPYTADEALEPFRLNSCLCEHDSLAQDTVHDGRDQTQQASRLKQQVFHWLSIHRLIDVPHPENLRPVDARPS